MGSRQTRSSPRRPEVPGIVERALDQTVAQARHQVDEGVKASRDHADRQPDQHGQPVDSAADVGSEIRVPGGSAIARLPRQLAWPKFKSGTGAASGSRSSLCQPACDRGQPLIPSGITLPSLQACEQLVVVDRLALRLLVGA